MKTLLRASLTGPRDSVRNSDEKYFSVPALIYPLGIFFSTFTFSRATLRTSYLFRIRGDWDKNELIFSTILFAKGIWVSKLSIREEISLSPFSNWEIYRVESRIRTHYYFYSCHHLDDLPEGVVVQAANDQGSRLSPQPQDEALEWT